MIFQTRLTETMTGGTKLLERYKGKGVFGQTFSRREGKRHHGHHGVTSAFPPFLSHIIESQNQKNFDEPLCLNDLKKKTFLTVSTGRIESSQYLIEIFLFVIEKRVVVKKRVVVEKRVIVEKHVVVEKCVIVEKRLVIEKCHS